MNLVKNKYITGIIVIYAISLMTSKFGITVLGAGISILSMIFFFYTKEKKEMTFFFLMYFIGIVFQFGSLGEIKSALTFSYKTCYFLITPFLIYYFRENSMSAFIFRMLEVSLFAGILKSFYNFYTVHHLVYTSGIRVTSFFDIMRWGIVLAMGLLLLLPNLYNLDCFFNRNYQFNS